MNEINSLVGKFISVKLDFGDSIEGILHKYSSTGIILYSGEEIYFISNDKITFMKVTERNYFDNDYEYTTGEEHNYLNDRDNDNTLPSIEKSIDTSDYDLSDSTIFDENEEDELEGNQILYSAMIPDDMLLEDDNASSNKYPVEFATIFTETGADSVIRQKTRSYRKED